MPGDGAGSAPSTRGVGCAATRDSYCAPRAAQHDWHPHASPVDAGAGATLPLAALTDDADTTPFRAAPSPPLGAQSIIEPPATRASTESNAEQPRHHTVTSVVAAQTRRIWKGRRR